MFDEGRAICERLLARAAAIRPVPRVRPKMGGECAVVAERLVAELTQVIPPLLLDLAAVVAVVKAPTLHRHTSCGSDIR